MRGGNVLPRRGHGPHARGQRPPSSGSWSSRTGVASSLAGVASLTDRPRCPKHAKQARGEEDAPPPSRDSTFAVRRPGPRLLARTGPGRSTAKAESRTLVCAYGAKQSGVDGTRMRVTNRHRSPRNRPDRRRSPLPSSTKRREFRSPRHAVRDRSLPTMRNVTPTSRRSRRCTSPPSARGAGRMPTSCAPSVRRAARGPRATS